jgi:hypothetical protein
MLAATLLCASAAAQQRPLAAKASASPVPLWDVKLSPDPNLSMNFSDNLLLLSTQCDADGNPYASIFSPEEPYRQVAAFTKKGVVTLATNDMTEIPEPNMTSIFIGDSALYALVSGVDNAKKVVVTEHDENGEELKLSRTVGERRDFIARFDLDGSYRGSIKLDAGFRPMQIAVFGSGDFAVAGVDEESVPRAWILNARGQFLTYLELPNDITDYRRKNVEKNFADSEGLDAATDVIAMFAAFYAYHGNILLVRSGNVSPIYEIREGGEAREVRVKAPDGLQIGRLIPSDTNWLIDFRGKLLDKKTDAIYEVSPETGEMMRQYHIESEEGSKDEVSCMVQGSLIGLRHSKGRLTVVRGTAEPHQNKAPPNPQ